MGTVPPLPVAGCVCWMVAAALLFGVSSSSSSSSRAPSCSVASAFSMGAIPSALGPASTSAGAIRRKAPFQGNGYRRRRTRPVVRSGHGGFDFDLDATKDGDNVAGKETAGSLSTNGADGVSRRDVLRSTVSVSSAASVLAAVATGWTATERADAEGGLPSFLEPPDRRSNGGLYQPAKRATCYLVDATIPPTLIPYSAPREAAILKNLGTGRGTPKTPLIEEGINLNNILNKAVFGTAGLLGDAIRGGPKDARSGPGYASFVFFGVDYDDPADADLAASLLTEILRPRDRQQEGSTALGLAFAPQSTQSALDAFSRDGDGNALLDALEAAGVSRLSASSYLPLLQLSRSKRVALLALAPEAVDIRTVRADGLQSVDLERRARYVADTEGFINLTQDPRFKLYAEKSLLKDFAPLSDKDGTGDFFAERILVHEACATAVARWAADRPDSLVAVVAPVADVRFMGGINGRVPRICKYLNSASLVDEEAVTTILLNPSAKETLSKSNFIRLEIGTAPSNWAYQTKVADYLWFSSMPKVNMIPRLMNGS